MDNSTTARRLGTYLKQAKKLTNDLLCILAFTIVVILASMLASKAEASNFTDNRDWLISQMGCVSALSYVGRNAEATTMREAAIKIAYADAGVNQLPVIAGALGYGMGVVAGILTGYEQMNGRDYARDQAAMYLSSDCGVDHG